MRLFFITGNKSKFEEVKGVLSFIKQFNVDLPEIQEIDSRKIIKFKLLEAFRHKNAVSMRIIALDKLKHFLNAKQ